MPIGTSDGEYFDNKFEAMVGSGVTAGLKRVPVYKSAEVNPGVDPGDEKMVVDPGVMFQNKELDKIETDPAYGIGRDVSYRMPLGSPTEPAGALKQEEGTRVAPPNNFDLSPNLPEVPSGWEQFKNDIFGAGENDIRPALGHFYEGVKNAFKLPGDVYAGKIDPMSQQGIERAFDLAGLMVTGPAPIASKMADGTLGSFAGVKAMKGDKLKDLQRAQILEGNAASKDEIFKETGMFKGSDSRWRYEIDDSKATLAKDWVSKGNLTNKIGGSSAKLSEVLDHPELYKAYPELRDFNVVYDPYHPSAHAAFRKKEIVVGPHFKDDLGTFIHETQHLVQDIEGFAGGGAPMKATKDYRLRYQKAFEEIKPELEGMLAKSEDPKAIWTTKDVERLKELGHIASRYKVYVEEANKQAGAYYMRMAGEVEARNVEIRMLLDKAGRRKIHPEATQDYPQSQEIIMPYHSSTTAYGVMHPQSGHIIKPTAPEPTNFRRAANENLPEGHPDRPYNVRDPSMIGSKEADDALDLSWKQMGEKHKKENELRDQRMELINKEEAKGKNAWKDELQLARFNKLGKEIADLYGDPFEPLKF